MQHVRLGRGLGQKLDSKTSFPLVPLTLHNQVSIQIQPAVFGTPESLVFLHLFKHAVLWAVHAQPPLWLSAIRGMFFGILLSVLSGTCPWSLHILCSHSVHHAMLLALLVGLFWKSVISQKCLPCPTVWLQFRKHCSARISISRNRYQMAFWRQTPFIEESFYWMGKTNACLQSKQMRNWWISSNERAASPSCFPLEHQS